MTDSIHQKAAIAVEVFKTNVEEPEVAVALVEKLLSHFPGSRINFDLNDCDKILRIEGKCISTEKIIQLVSAAGYQLELLL